MNHQMIRIIIFALLITFAITCKKESDLKDPQSKSQIKSDIPGSTNISLDRLKDMNALLDKAKNNGSQGKTETDLPSSINKDVNKQIQDQLKQSGLSGNDISPIIQAARSNDLAKLKEAIKAGGNVNIQESIFQMAPLHFSVVNNNFDMLKYLLEEAKANINLKDKEGFTCFMMTIGNGKKDFFEYILKKHITKIDKKIKDTRGAGPIDYAAMRANGAAMNNNKDEYDYYAKLYNQLKALGFMPAPPPKNDD